MKTLKGIGVSPGFAVGKALVFHTDDEFSVAPQSISTEDIAKEIARFEDALTCTRAEILGIRKKLSAQIGHEHSDIFNAHLLILEDRTLIEDVIALLKKDMVNAEYAFATVVKRYFQVFAEIDDEYLRERISDIKDVGRRVLQNLYGEEKRSIDTLREKVVIVAHDLSPSDTATLDRSKILAFVTEVGGPTSHTAILARSMEIPAIVGVDRVTAQVKRGDPVIVDGAHGIFILDPDESSLEECSRQEKIFSDQVLELDKLKNLPAETPDGHKILVGANIEFHDEIPSVISHGAEGIGLYRTEYFYLNRIDLPTEEEQFRAYKQVAERMSPQSVIIRTLDLGGDKFASSLEVPQEMNPFLGWRAIRFCLARIDIFKAQLRAIMRASAYGSLKVMYPMISNVQELMRANEILKECCDELDRERVEFDRHIQIGAMIEIPSAALMSDILARHVNFFSIGTNDLIQYTLAVDRINEKIAYLYQPTHPAILRLIHMTVENGHKAGIWVGVCGEMSMDPTVAILLLGLGIDEISTSPFVVPKVKKAIRSVSYDKAKLLAEKAMQFHTAEEVQRFLVEEVKGILPDLLD